MKFYLNLFNININYFYYQSSNKLTKIQFKDGENAETLGLDGTELFDIIEVKNIEPFSEVYVIAKKSDGKKLEFKVIARLDSSIDVEYYQNGGVLYTIL